ncbi:MAG: DNA polymerase III subunit delta' [Chromatiales bacterium]|nr:DNA polymerase III subunit delta' [Chromatiales bacterium]
MSTAPYPWQRKAWTSVAARRSEDRLAHGLLLVGPNGLGKLDFAAALAKALFCHQPNEAFLPCGQCAACHWFSAGTHPDYLRLMPEESGKPIKVAAVRDLIGKLYLTSSDRGVKVALVHPADRMNANAANALLKTLEEPPQRTHLLLVTSRPSVLPPTIRSRCQRIHFQVPPREDSLKWLASQGVGGEPELLLSLGGGAPLAALKMDRDASLDRRRDWIQAWFGVQTGSEHPLAFAQRVVSDDLGRFLFWLTTWVQDLIRIRAGAGRAQIVNVDLGELLENFARSQQDRLLFDYLKQLEEAGRLLSVGINESLLFEDLMIAWGRMRPVQHHG